MSDDMRIYKSCGNVYKDLGLPDADELFIKAQLGFEIFSIIEERKWFLAQAAEMLGTDEAEIAPLMNGKFSGYNVERLFSFLNRLNISIDIYLKNAPQGAAYQQLHAAD